MGIPRGFRWIAERYPCLIQPAVAWQTPEFDNLYLDMNGIIHQCTHPQDQNPFIRISEEQMFDDIMNYIDFLFKLIKPNKVLFLAVDGVAPRAKMNHQRSRRFRTAKEATKKEEEAIEKNQSLPETERFDSNCITPGTKFMIKLQEKLKYFIVEKVSTDEEWKSVKVYLSGHDVPGEGEHKIMDFIRYCKSQPDYNPYTRHCLYGLDCDLVMLSLATHQPYFALLREEVKFTPVNDPTMTSNKPEKLNFQLFHLNLLRNYIEVEFASIKLNHPSLFNIESILDDFVFMCMLVGNDFIPHLPTYHISENALSILIRAYIEIMPQMNGYINEQGNLNLDRLQIFLSKLAVLEQNLFQKKKELFVINENDVITNHHGSTQSLDQTMDTTMDLLMNMSMIKLDTELNSTTDVDPTSGEEDNETKSHEEEEEDESESLAADQQSTDLQADEFELFRNEYYKRKLNFQVVNEDCIKKLTHSYIEALQWNLYYYYNGCQSWSWFYPYHYAPYINDMIRFNGFKDIKLEFEMSQPLSAYEQLLAVLPIASKQFLPESYQNVMCNDESPLAGSYPEDFSLDLNGKQFEWEAIALIPFIEEEKLHQASEIAKQFLTEEEILNNQHGDHLLFNYTDKKLFDYLLPGLPDITDNHAECTIISRDEFRLPVDQIKKGISKKIKLYTHFYGYPSLNFLKFTAQIRNERVKVFQTVSKHDNVILELDDIEANKFTNLIKYLGRDIYHNWPYPKEGRLVSLFDGDYLHFLKQTKNQKLKIVTQRPARQLSEFYIKKVQEIKNNLLQSRGIVIRNETCLCIFTPVIGYSHKVNDDGTIVRLKQYSTEESFVLGKTVMPRLKTLQPYKPMMIGPRPLYLSVKQMQQEDVILDINATDLYKIGRKCFVLDHRYYGDSAEILFFDEMINQVALRIQPAYEPDISEIVRNEGDILSSNYINTNQMAANLQMLPSHLSKMTGSVYVSHPKEPTYNFNIGLNLKYKRNGLPNYSIYFEGCWYFSNEVYQTVCDYIKRFPLVVDQISNYNFNSLDYRALFPVGDADKQFKELMKFINELPMRNEKRKSMDTRLLDRCVVYEIEDALKASINSLVKLRPVQIGLEVSEIYCPSFSHFRVSHPDPNANFELYDRVVNVKQGIPVPVGLKGIVIAIEKGLEKVGNAMVTIVFDQEFDGGQKINTRDNRAFILPQCYLINISYGKIQKPKRTYYQSTSYRSRSNQQQATDSYDDYTDDNNNSYIPNRSSSFRYENQYFTPSYQQVSASGQESTQTDKHLDVWHKLMKSATEALKDQTRENPLTNLTFNPTINLIKNPQTVSKSLSKKAIKVNTLESEELN